MRKTILIAGVFSSLLLASCSPTKSRVDLVLVHGRFDTLDGRLPVAEAVAVNKGVVVGVGSNSAVLAHFTASVTIDLKGAYVLPGLIDGHAHMVALGVSLSTLDLIHAKSVKDVDELVQKAAKKFPAGSWIRGSGWSPAIWPGPDFHADKNLDSVAPGDYVFLVSSDGQAIWVNSKVLDLAGITNSTPEPKGGKIIRDKRGNPTGILVGSAINLVAEKMPPPGEHEIENAIMVAADTCARYGLTEVQDAGISERTLRAYENLDREHKLKIRVYAMYDGNDTTLPDILKKGPISSRDGYFTMRSVRVDMDGTLHSRQAALVHSYSDDPASYGMTLMSGKSLENLTIASLSSGFQVCTEAHGDRAVNVALNAYQRALKIAKVGDPRLRIEGADVLLPRDIGKFEDLNVLPSMQPARLTSDMFWIERLLGARRVSNYDVWKSLLDTGTIIIGGSDFPYESPDPRLGIYASVTREDANGLPGSFADARRYFSLSPDALADSSDFDRGFFPAQRMNMEEAIKAFTKWPAFGAFQEKEKGSISVWKDADFTILASDLRKLPPRDVLSDHILATLVGGKLVYASPLWKNVSFETPENN